MKVAYSCGTLMDALDCLHGSPVPKKADLSPCVLWQHATRLQGAQAPLSLHYKARSVKRCKDEGLVCLQSGMGAAPVHAILVHELQLGHIG